MQAQQGLFLELVRRCVEEGSVDAWEQFTRRVQPMFARAAYRIAREYGSVQREDIDDLLQDILVRIAERGAERLRRLPAESDSAALAYLNEIALNAARDHFRIAGAAKRGASVTDSVEASVVERISCFPAEAEVERKILLDQIDGCLKVPARDRTVFWLYYRTGLSAREIAELPSISVGVKGVESLIFRLTKSVKDCLRGKGKGAVGAF